MSSQGQGDNKAGTPQTDSPQHKKENKHWWQNNPIRRLSMGRNRTCSESSDAPDSPTHESKGRRFSVGDSIEKHCEKRERWVRNYNVPPECFIPPWT